MITHEHAEEVVKRGALIHLGVYVAVVGSLMALNFGRPHAHPWSLWVAGGWGIGVVAHAASVFGSNVTRERMTQRTMARLERRGR